MIMALQFVIGATGTGKTHHCMQEILAAQKTQTGRQILLVPEQFTCLLYTSDAADEL